MHDFFHLYQPDTVFILLCNNVIFNMILQVVIECSVSFLTKFFYKLFLV